MGRIVRGMSKNNFCESNLEEATLEWLEELGYEIVFAPEGEYAVSNSLRSKNPEGS